ncbi:MAG: uL15 family ribosomal protein [archaeon]|nr:uL15 family ribosomal protein [archaeon]
MLSKTKITQRIGQKTDPYLAEAIFLAKKSGNIELAGEIACPTKKQAKINVGRLNEVKSDTIIVPGKILSSGNLNKKLKVYALSFSKTAEEKLKKAGCEYQTILNALKKGEKLKGEILR